ncbi:S-adenosyl-L-methionine-dependent tRNA 4-demethylwyosine synthase TYW1-like [Amazona ochrocephala]
MDTWSFFSTCLVSLWLHRLYVYSAVAFGISIWIVIQFSTSKPQKKDENPTGNPASSEAIEEKLVNGCATLQRKEVCVARVKIFYGSQTGTAKRFARALAEAVISLNVPVEVISMGDYDPDDCLLEEVGRDIDRWLWVLSTSRVMTRAEGDRASMAPLRPTLKPGKPSSSFSFRPSAEG